MDARAVLRKCQLYIKSSEHTERKFIISAFSLQAFAVGINHLVDKDQYDGPTQ